MALAFGVDVVDLAHPQVAGRVLSDRFLARVFTDAERRHLSLAPASGAGGAPLIAWQFWAAKEAAFKAATLRAGIPPVFAHREFDVVIDEAGKGAVEWRAHRFVVRAVVAEGRVLAWAADDDAVLNAAVVRSVAADLDAAGSDQGDMLTEREAASVHSPASARVRLGVRREAATVLKVAESRLEVICDPGPRGQVPPFLHLDGQRLDDVSISVSHHGRHLAWGVVVPDDQRSRGR